MSSKVPEKKIREFNEEPEGKPIDLGECAMYDWEKGCYVIEPCSVRMFTPEQLKRRDKINKRWKKSRGLNLEAMGRLV